MRTNALICAFILDEQSMNTPSAIKGHTCNIAIIDDNIHTTYLELPYRFKEKSLEPWKGKGKRKKKFK